MALGLGAILSGIGLVKGFLDGNSAKKKANAANKRANALTNRQVALFDMLQGIVEAADKGGAFDPERQIAQLEKDTARYEALDMGNTAGALRVSGYRQGDSEIGNRLDAVKLKYRNDLDTMREGIRRQSFFDRLNAYNSINPGLLSAGINQANQNAANAQAQANANSPLNLVSSIMPFLGREGGGSSGTGNANTSSTSNWALPVSYNVRDNNWGTGWMQDSVSSGKRKPWQLDVSYRGGR